jgi:hypothetical protein
MNYAQEQRLRFIDCMLVYYGYIGRQELCDFFGVGEATATRDFRLYGKIASDNLVMDTKAKCWQKSKNFNRIFA